MPQKAAIFGPLAINTIEKAFHLQANDGLTLNAGLVNNFVIFQGIRPSIAKKPYNFVIFP